MKKATSGVFWRSNEILAMAKYIGNLMIMA